MTSAATPVCAVAIPARDEAALIGRCLESLAAQTVRPGYLAVTILANNCTDETADIARASHWPMQMTVIEECFAGERAHAGTARRLAMENAASQSVFVLTTDADCVVDRDWVANMLVSFVHGADAVAGRVSGDWTEMQTHDPAALAIGALEWEYLTLLAEAEARFDPRSHDPWPRHSQQCGANIGITRKMLTRVGGVPALPNGEDRALLRAVDAAGGRVRHDLGPHVTASARTYGRAVGGMADALAARVTPDYCCDDRFEAAHTLVARLKARSHARQEWDALPSLRAADFSAAWERDLAQRPELQPIPLRPDQLAEEITTLRHLIQNSNGRATLSL